MVQGIQTKGPKALGFLQNRLGKVSNETHGQRENIIHVAAPE